MTELQITLGAMFAMFALFASITIPIYLHQSRQLQKQMDRRFDQVDRRFDKVDERFDKVDERFRDNEKDIKILINDVAEIRGALSLRIGERRREPTETPA